MYPRSVEWPTIAVAGAIAVGLAGVLGWGDRLPAVATIAALALLAAWYNSLQHEIIHGHPTPSPRWNTMLGSAPLGLVFPFERYRETHLAHHRDEFLTDPSLDPESFYVTEAEWARRNALSRLLLVSLQTLAGRMVLGPFVYGARFWRRFVASWPTDRAARRQGLAHLARVALILTVVVASPLPLWEYLLGAGWFGASISLVRSFAEHRAVVTGSRTAVVRSGRFFSLLFLNNNLHSTHHAHPGLAWYRIPAVHAMSTFDQESAAGAGLYSGYAEVVRRFCFRPTWIPVHPRSLQNS